MEKEINPQKHAMTPLMVTAAEGDEAHAAELIASGVDINAQDNRGGTALMYAAMNNHPKMVALLIDAGADTTIKTMTGATAQSFSYHANSSEITKLLVNANKRNTKSAIGVSNTRIWLLIFGGSLVGYFAIKFLVLLLGGEMGEKIIGIGFLSILTYVIAKRLMSKSSEDGLMFKLIMAAALLMAIIMIGANVAKF